MFNSLKEEDIHKIIDIELIALHERVENMGYHLKLDKKAKSFIADKGFDVHFGARPLKRAIQKYLEDPIADIILKKPPASGTLISVKYEKNKLRISLLQPKPKR